jgi:hypothetical protein
MPNNSRADEVIKNLKKTQPYKGICGLIQNENEVPDPEYYSVAYDAPVFTYSLVEVQQMVTVPETLARMNARFEQLENLIENYPQHRHYHRWVREIQNLVYGLAVLESGAL